VERKVANRVRSQRWYLRFPRAVPVGIFLMVSAITALSVYAIEQVEIQRSDAQDRQMAMTVRTAVERLAGAHVAYLKASAALLSSEGEVTRGAFRELAEQVARDDTLRGGGTLGWSLFVPAARIPELEARMRREGEAGFAVHPRTTDRAALVLIYLEPRSRTSVAAIGYNVLGDATRRAAVERAIGTGRPAASGPITLLSDPNGRRLEGFGIFAAVRAPARNGQPAQVAGVLARAFNAQSFLHAALAPEQLHAYGVSLYEGDGTGAKGAPLAAIGPQNAPSHRLLRPIEIAGRTMTIALSPPPGTTLSNLSILTLLFGMMVAALLLIVARLVTRQAAEDRAALAWFEEQASIRNSLTRELNHRVKNTLANVMSIVALTRRRAENIDDFVAGLTGRIRALSATHDLLTQSDWGTTPVRAVLGAELSPYAQDSDREVVLRGPHVELAPNDALSLGLAVHELATNAAKYGALSIPGGRVEVSWDMMTDKLARIEWRESGGPPVAERRRSGFGTELIEKIVAHELKNPVNLQFDLAGVRCTLIVPVRQPVAFQLRETVPG